MAHFLDTDSSSLDNLVGNASDLWGAAGGLWDGASAAAGELFGFGAAPASPMNVATGRISDEDQLAMMDIPEEWLQSSPEALAETIDNIDYFERQSEISGFGDQAGGLAAEYRGGLEGMLAPHQAEAVFTRTSMK
jgi:hypothetical protein